MTTNSIFSLLPFIPHLPRRPDKNYRANAKKRERETTIFIS